MACPIAIVQVITTGIIVVDGQLDEAEAENPGVEIDVPLRIAGDRGDVMDAVGCCLHHQWFSAPVRGKPGRRNTNASPPRIQTTGRLDAPWRENAW
jgi:hypothetical protein